MDKDDSQWLVCGLQVRNYFFQKIDLLAFLFYLLTVAEFKF